MGISKNDPHAEERHRVLRESVALGAMSAASKSSGGAPAPAGLGYVMEALQKVCEIVLEAEIQIKREPEKAKLLRAIYAAKVALLIDAIGLLDGRVDQ